MCIERNFLPNAVRANDSTSGFREVRTVVARLYYIFKYVEQLIYVLIALCVCVHINRLACKYKNVRIFV